VESVADRTETHAVVDNNIQASSKDISVQLSTLLPLTIECAIGLIVGLGGALQMQLLLILCRMPGLTLVIKSVVNFIKVPARIFPIPFL